MTLISIIKLWYLFNLSKNENQFKYLPYILEYPVCWFLQLGIVGIAVGLSLALPIIYTYTQSLYPAYDIWVYSVYYNNLILCTC